MLASMGIALALHVLSAVVWVGGMFFAYLCLRPAVAPLTPAERTALWARVLGRFFRWVLIAVPLILLSGLWMMMNELPVVPLRVHLMLGIGIFMMLLFLHVYFAPFRRLQPRRRRRRHAAGGGPGRHHPQAGGGESGAGHCGGGDRHRRKISAARLT